MSAVRQSGRAGIFVTIPLYVLTPLSSAEVAGTAHVTFIAVDVIGALAYARSGELADGDGYALAVILSAASILGALAGAHLNTYVSRCLFGVILGAIAASTGLVLLHRQRSGLATVAEVDPGTRNGRVVFDPLRDDGNAYAKRLEEAGVSVDHRQYDGMIRDFMTMLVNPELPQAREVIAAVASNLQSSFESS